jgi:hypothetical protein
MTLLKRLKSEEVFAYAHAVWPDNLVAELVGLNAVETIDKVCAGRFMFFTGKSVKSILGGLFYLLGYRVGSPRKQRIIATTLETTDVTIRTAYKEWLEEFPDLFMDVIGKFASEHPPRYHQLFYAMEEKPLTSEI